MHFISKTLAALLCVLLAASPAWSGSMTLLGVGKAGAAVAGPAYTYQGAFFTSPGGATTTQLMPFDIGAAQADRLLVFWTGAGGVAISSVVVDPTGANVTLTLDAAGTSNRSQLYSGIVATGSGTVNIAVTYGSNAQFDNLVAHLWRLTGMISNVKQSSVGGTFNPGTTISVTAPCFLFTGVGYGAPNTGVDWATSTVLPAAIHTDSNTNSFAADWTISATNASFADNPKVGSSNNMAAATYH